MEFESGSRTLYEFEKPTHDLDQGIELHWTPRVISQAHSDWDGDGRNDLIFFDYRNRVILVAEERIDLPAMPGNPAEYEFPLLFAAKLPGDERVDLILGRMSDAVYRRGETVDEMVWRYPYHWRRRDSSNDRWEEDFQHGYWSSPVDVPLIADHDDDGFDSHLAYRPREEQWYLYPGELIEGPSMPDWMSPLPFAGRFLPGSTGDLALWSPTTGELTVRSVRDDETVSINWGGRPGDVLLPGDYDGDGYDEVGIWQPHTNLWWVRQLPSGPNRYFTFGTSSSVPLPADYNQDGQLDLAYWEPAEQRIYVSFDAGQSVGRTIEVAPHSIPLFVNFY